MSKQSKPLSRGRIAVAVALSCLPLAFHATPALAQTGKSAQINVGAPVTLGATIVSGQTSVQFTLPVSALDGFRLQATVPVPDVTLTLIDPSGTPRLLPGDAGVALLEGSTLSPPLPGRQFLTPEITNPADGDWTLRFDFPASPHATAAVVTVLSRTPVQVGLALTGQVFRVGQPVPLGLLAVNNGQPIGGLSPTLTISKPGSPTTVLQAVDSGQATDFDGKAGDGIYSKGTTFTEPGNYQLLGEASILLPGGQLARRSAQASIDIVPANYTFGSISGVINRGTANCVASLDVNTAGSASLAGDYATVATLRSPNGKTLVKRTGATLTAPGALNTSTRFTAAEIRTQLAEGGVFTVDPLDVLNFISGQPWLELRKASAYNFPSIALSQLCADPIEINASATVAAPLRGKFIGQLDFTLPIRVTTAGAYQVSFKVIDNKGVEVGQFGLSPNLAVGSNNVSASVLANRLQSSDGPFTIDSVLVVSGGRSAQASRVPVTASDFSRWQFFPTITGDLNGDGAVGAADRDIVLQSRGQVPRIPGDRRDINGDGKIDLLDAREIVNRQCSAGACPKN